MFGKGDRISEVYKGEVSHSDTQRITRERVHWLASQAGPTTLDIGCGQGIVSILAAKTGVDVIGIDTEAAVIAYAQADLMEAVGKLPGSVRFQQADGAELPFDNGLFDVVLLGEVVQHLTQPSVVLAEASRVLTRGGRIAITTPYGYHPHHDHEQTYYAASLLKVVAGSFSILSIDIVDGHFRVVGRNAITANNDVSHLVGLQSQVEAISLSVERSLSEMRDLHESAVVDLATANSTISNVARRREADAARAEALELELQEAEDDRFDQAAKSYELSSDLSEEVQLRRHVEKRNRRLVTQMARVEHDRIRLRHTVALERWKLGSMKERKWWRAGQSFQAIRRSPLRILMLPFDLISIAFSKGNLPTRPEPPQLQEPATKNQKHPGPESPRPQAALSPSEPHHGLPAFEIPEMPLPEVAPRRPSLVVATVLDEFSEVLYQYEWTSAPVTPATWKTTFEERQPDLLFVESAWRGQNGSWIGEIANQSEPGKQLVEMTNWCRDHGVPTVFWSNEDPPNFDSFIGSARLFEHVFTVDADAIPRYKEALGHDRIGVLPFSAQPRIHNPIAVTGGRRRAVAFAGNYYTAKHEKREDQMEFILDPARGLGLEIFSRFDAAELREEYSWPDKYHSHIVGNVPYDTILSLAKMYKVFLNVNSVTESSTMCARRVFELLAAGTPIVTGPSKAILQTFPRSVLPVSNNENDTKREIQSLLDDRELRSRRGVTGIRAILSEHTADHRVRTVLDALGIDYESEAKCVSMIAPTNRAHLVPSILSNAGRQRYGNLELVLLLHDIEESTLATSDVEDAAAQLGINHLQVLRVPKEWPLGTVLNEGFAAASGDYIGRIDDDDYYAPEYLGDQIRAFSYADADIIGKWSHYAHLAGTDVTILRFAGREYTYRDLILGPTMLMRRSVFDAVQFEPIPRGSDTAFLRAARAQGIRVFATDQLNFLYHRDSDPSNHTYVQTDEYFLSQGTVMWDGQRFDRVGI